MNREFEIMKNGTRTRQIGRNLQKKFNFKKVIND